MRIIMVFVAVSSGLALIYSVFEPEVAVMANLMWIGGLIGAGLISYDQNIPKRNQRR